MNIIHCVRTQCTTIYTKTGRRNSVRESFAKYRGGSMKEDSWTKVEGHHKGYHSCCGSKRAYRHKRTCYKVAVAQEKGIQPFQYNKIKELKDKGYDTKQVAQIVNKPLEEVNRQWCFL